MKPFPSTHEDLLSLAIDAFPPFFLKTVVVKESPLSKSIERVILLPNLSTFQSGLGVYGVICIAN